MKAFALFFLCLSKGKLKRNLPNSADNLRSHSSSYSISRCLQKAGSKSYSIYS